MKPGTDQKVHILVAEDSPTHAFQIRRLLEKNVYTVEVVEDGQKAWETLEQGKLPDIVISDIYMPRMDGFTLCKTINAHPVIRKVPVILITSFSDRMDIIHAMQSGAKYLLSRPFEESQLIKRIENVLENKALQQPITQGQKIDLFYDGKHYSIQNDPLQMIHLLLSTFETTVQQTEDQRQLARNYDMIFNSTQDAMFLVEEAALGEFRYLQTNLIHQKDTGITLDEIRGKTPQELMGEHQGMKAVANYQRCLQAQKPITYESSIDLPDGKRTWLTTLTPVLTPGKPALIVGSKKDITMQKTAQEEVERRERELRTILETSMDGYWALDLSGRITDVNDAYCQMTGYTRDELLQMSIPDLDPFEEPQDTKERIHRILTHGAEQFEACHRAKDGSILEMEISASCPHPKDRIFCFCRDITERKKAEHQLILQSQLQRMLLKISSSFINATLDQIDHLIQAALRDLAAFVHADRAFIALYDFEKQIGKGIFEWCDKEITPQIQRSQQVPLSIAPEWVEAHRKGKSFSVDRVGSMPDSPLKSFLMDQQVQSFITVPMIQEEDCIGFVGFDWVRTAHHDADIEEPLLRLFAQMLVNVEIRKASQLKLTQTQTELLESRERYRRLSEDMPVFVCSCLPDGTVLYVNPLCAQLLKMSPEELKGKNFFAFAHPEQQGALQAHLAQLTPQKQILSQIQQHTQPDGLSRWQKWVHRGFFDEQGTLLYIQAVGQDITNEKKAEEDLQKALEEAEKGRKTLDALMEHIPIGVTIADDKMEIQRVSRWGLELMGWPREKHVGLSVDEILKQWEVYLADGKTKARVAELPLPKAIAHGETVLGQEIVQVNRNGVKIPLICDAGPIRDTQDQIIGGVIAWQDMTQQIKTKERILHQLQCSEMVRRITRTFIRAQPDTIDTMIQDMLQECGEFFQVDRVYVFQVSDDDQFMIKTHLWNSPQIETQKYWLSRASMATFQWFREQLITKDRIQIDCSDDFPIEAKAEREEFQRQGMQSLLIVPMYDNKARLIGLFGMDMLDRSRIWEQNTIPLIQVLADTLSDAFQKVRLEKDWMEAKEQAQAASKAKSQFVSNMSHEIRTPLNGVIGFSEILALTPMTPEQTEYLGYIASSAKSLLSLVNDIIDLSKIEAGMIELRLEESSIEDLCRSAMDSVRHQAQSKGLSLSMEIDPELIHAHVETDTDRLRQVLLNLLSNAVKFTQEGRITLTVSKDSEIDEEENCELRFSITDTGQGIEEKEREKIFEDFYQTDASATRKQGGSGLGLAICRRILHALGSRLDLVSQIGAGSTFSFRLRLKVISFAHSTGPDEKHMDVDGPQRPITNWKESTSKVLIVEDNPINQKLIKTLLTKHLPHTSLFFADNGIEAVKKWEAFDPDLILMDLLMPEMDGIEATQIIRSQQTGDHTPIIALTAAAESQDMERCLEAGMDGYLTKPILLEKLMAVLERWLGTSKDP